MKDPTREPVGLKIMEYFMNLRSKVCKLPSGYQGLAVTSNSYRNRKLEDKVIQEGIYLIIFFIIISNVCLRFSGNGCVSVLKVIQVMPAKVDVAGKKYLVDT